MSEMTTEVQEARKRLEDLARKMSRGLDGSPIADDIMAILTAYEAREAERDDFRRKLDDTLADYSRYVHKVHDQDERANALDAKTIADALYRKRYPRAMGGIEPRGHPSHDRIWAEADAVVAALSGTETPEHAK